MSEYANLVERCITEQGLGALGPVTTQGNNSISYLPGGFTSMRNALVSLGVYKKQWGIKVLDEDLKYKVVFEDAFDISIPKMAFKEFNEKVLNVIGKESIDLNQMINEVKSELVHDLYDELNKVLTVDVRENRQIKKTLVLLNYWLTIFPGSKYLPISSKAAIQLEQFDSSIRNLIDQVKNIYADDIGNLQILLRNVKEDRPLNGYAPFSECDYLTAVRVQSEYKGITLTLELTVNLAMIAGQSILIESAEALEELEAFRSIKVVKDMVFPVGEMFSPSIFYNLRKTIETLEEPGPVKETKKKTTKKKTTKKKNAKSTK
jgi:hypothetical protein